MQLVFGATAPSVSEQLKDNVRISKGDLKQFDRDADAIVRLNIRGVIPDSQARQARKKLLKKIETAFNKKSK